MEDKLVCAQCRIEAVYMYNIIYLLHSVRNGVHFQCGIEAVYM